MAEYRGGPAPEPGGSPRAALSSRQADLGLQAAPGLGESFALCDEDDPLAGADSDSDSRRRWAMRFAALWKDAGTARGLEHDRRIARAPASQARARYGADVSRITQT